MYLGGNRRWVPLLKEEHCAALACIRTRLNNKTTEK